MATVKQGKIYSEPFCIAEVVTSARVDTSGYAEIRNDGTLLTFTGATIPALANATYDLDITVDGVLRQVDTPLVNTDSWTSICSKIQARLRTITSGLQTVALVNGKIRVTSATDGASSTILLAVGTKGSGGGDILAAINAITGYDPALETPVGGVEGAFAIQVSPDVPTTKDFLFSAGCLDSSGHAKALTYSFSKTTGKATVTDGVSDEMAVGDHVVLIGVLA